MHACVQLHAVARSMHPCQASHSLASAMGSSHGRDRSLGIASSRVRCCCSFSSRRSLDRADCGRAGRRARRRKGVAVVQQLRHGCGSRSIKRAARRPTRLTSHAGREPHGRLRWQGPGASRAHPMAWCDVLPSPRPQPGPPRPDPRPQALPSPPLPHPARTPHLRHCRALQRAVWVLDDLDGAHLDAAARALALGGCETRQQGGAVGWDGGGG